MDASTDYDWKKKVGFPINYDSGQSSDDDFDTKEVVMRRHSSRYLLADGGDGSEADLLGTTPPRSRIRDKEKRRTIIDSGTSLHRLIREKRDTVDYSFPSDQNSPLTERLKKRSSLKLIRNKERDWKQDMAHREPKADSLPSPNPLPAVPPTLVESCSRFMSLTSRPKCKELMFQDKAAEEEVEERWKCSREDELPASRVNFHKTFSMLINMGNIDKSCRRTISHEEQVWQNELKDLIWLELQAKIAGRTLAQQDAYLCTQRNIVPTLIKNISDYRFVNRNPCRNRSQRLTKIQGSREDLVADSQAESDANLTEDVQDEDLNLGCLSFDCQQCSDAVGSAMREVCTLLDAFYNAVSLYPSTKAMTADHPLIATKPFNDRLKAMCLWSNTALNMRVKMLSVRGMLRAMRLKGAGRGRQRPSLDSNTSRHSVESQRPCQVRFSMGNTPTDSSNSDSSHSDVIKEEKNSDEAEASSDEKRESDAEQAKTEDETSTEGRRDADETDSGVGSAKLNGQVTPEIVVSSRYGTADTVISDESGYLSEGNFSGHWHPSLADVYEIGPLAELTQLRLLNKCNVSLYREHHCEVLKTQGVRRSMMFMHKMRKNILQKAYLTLQKPDIAQEPTLFTEDDPTEVFEDPKEDEKKSEQVHDENFKKTYELRRYGCWSEECRSMRLPSYRCHFLLLSSICMEAVHDYLSFRLETRPEHPSCLTVKQLIHELKEGLDISSEMRKEFVRDVAAAVGGMGEAKGKGRGRGEGEGSAPHADPLLLLSTFDATVEAVLEQYLSYMRTMSATEYLSRSYLQAEWGFTARLAKRIKCAALLAPLAFADITCNQLNRLVEQFDAQLKNIKEVSELEQADPSRHSIFVVCRLAQGVYAESREPTLGGAQWARALAARLARAPPPAYLPQRRDIFNSLMSVREFIVAQVAFIVKKSEGAIAAGEGGEGVALRVRELLLHVFKLGFELHKELYKFAHAPFNVVEQRSVRRARPSSLQPVRTLPTPAAIRRRPETVLIHESFNPLLHKELHRFVNDPALGRCVSSGRRSLNSPPKARSKFVRSDSIIEDYEASMFDDKMCDNFAETQCQNSDSIELLLSGGRAAQVNAQAQVQAQAQGRAQARAACEEERGWAERASRAVVGFAREWMRFVVDRCDHGRGTRPRWACQGLEFLMLACDPCNTQYLSDTEFEELKQEMDGCISHVIGSRPPPPRGGEGPAVCAGGPPSTSPRPRHRLHSPLSSSTASKDVPTPPTPPSEPEPLLSFHGPDSRSHRSRVLDAIERLEEDRESALRERKRVGRVVGAAVPYEPKLRQLTFKWQRGLKIGAGTFGKVYTVVNTESGQLLAMKELSIGAGDRRALSRAANELQVLEGVIHPHLVRYYGCELHREEMLIFMELCVEGSLEALVATSGALSEHTVRRYTKQLVSAVLALHTRNIAHRDIKSGNIFLTNEGHCLKLGDFGCAVKIRANTTAPYELQGFVGTQAYMAPEVFMDPAGHGRAADIWSLGCVVTEMASGKRPFSEYDYSNYQIMFMVGMGERPAIPPSLSEEGRQFCLGCLTHARDLRPTAEALSLHHFLMVNSDDDCKCEPSYMI